MIKMDRLPDQLKPKKLNGIYRMQRSLDLTNPASTSNAGDAIVLYDRAFNGLDPLTRVFLHELGHVIYQEISSSERAGYLTERGWDINPNPLLAKRPDTFVSSRAQSDADEDFAESFSSFLLEPTLLEKYAPSAHSWFTKEFPSSFKLKEDCVHENK